MSTSLFPDGRKASPVLTPARPEVSVVVPIYNEVESLPHLIEAIATSLNATGLSYELICVDDGSSDGSAELLSIGTSMRIATVPAIF